MLLEIAKIGKPHGLKGFVNVFAFSDRPERFEKGSVFQTEKNGELIIKDVMSLTTKSDYALLFEGINSREEAELLKGVILLAEPLDNSLLQDGEYWTHDLIDSTVVDFDTDEDLGVVENIISNPASDLLDLGQDKLIPLKFIKEFILEEKKIIVDIPPGLLDLNN